MMTGLKKYYREPLLHFLTMGVFLYALAELFVDDSSLRDSYAIDINQVSMVRFLQFQNKAFNAELALAKWQSMSPAEKQDLANDYIREEVMYREALNLGLEVDDQIIRRRLIQKIEFINTGFSSDVAKIDEDELQDYFKKHISDYEIDASITFSHVFFDKDNKLGAHQQLAGKALSELNQKNVPFENAAQYGQRFYFHRNYVDRTHNFVASHFGEAFSEQVSSLKQANIWYGPITSKYGSHLVMVKKNQPARLPDLVEVAPQVLQDLQRIKQGELKTKALGSMVEKYKINNTLKQPETSNTGEQHVSIR